MDKLQLILLKKILLEQKGIKSILRKNQQVSANFLARVTNIIIVVVFLGIGVYAVNNLTPEARSKQSENWIEKVILVIATGMTAKIFTSTNNEQKQVKEENASKDEDDLQEDRLELFIDDVIENEISNYRSSSGYNRLAEKDISMEGSKNQESSISGNQQ